MIIQPPHIVDGRNTNQPPGMYKTLGNNGINYQPQLVIAGFLNHQQYVHKFRHFGVFFSQKHFYESKLST